MSWKTICVCDVCGRERGEANHWIVTSQKVVYGCIGFYPWINELAEREGWQHLCSQECAQKILARFLDAALATPEAKSAPRAAGGIGHDLEYVPVCEYCGPVCHGGAEHNARVEDGAKLGGAE